FTSNEALATKIKGLRIHGQNKRYRHKYLGIGGRMDTIQAAVLLVKVKHFPEEIKNRQKVAGIYSELLEDLAVRPKVRDDRTSVWAQYSIRVKNRGMVQDGLKQAGIPTAVHYPMPLHLQECFNYLNHSPGDFPVAEAVSEEIMSLPMNPFLTRQEQEYIAATLTRICSQ
ncbi:MAG: DegT/DnrJ/EryC1/StrS family aminotransferase, partial [Syntrophobacterales bacterium]